MNPNKQTQETPLSSIKSVINDNDIFNELIDIIKIHDINYFNDWVDHQKINIYDVDNNRINHHIEVSPFEVNIINKRRFLKIFDVLYHIN
jgi:uncharacterized protein YcaQ